MRDGQRYGRRGDNSNIIKKDEGVTVEKYRGITVMSTLYKVYASVLVERLREETEFKKVIPYNQTGFRRGMGMMDNIYVLNYIVNRQVTQKGGNW